MFQGRCQKQLKGVATGSPISSIVANLYMENFEVKALSTSCQPPGLWKKYVDDTFVFIKMANKNEFLEHIKSIDKDLQFTVENTRADGSMPFLNTLVIPQSDGSLTTTVYRNLTHTDHYLHGNSHHAISENYSVVSTMHHRATTQHLQKEHLQKDLSRCKYPIWALNRMKIKNRA